VDMTEAIQQRGVLNARAEKDSKISLNDMVVRPRRLRWVSFPRSTVKLTKTI